jgi:hypothetical protein
MKRPSRHPGHPNIRWRTLSLAICCDFLPVDERSSAKVKLRRTHTTLSLNGGVTPFGSEV